MRGLCVGWRCTQVMRCVEGCGMRVATEETCRAVGEAWHGGSGKLRALRKNEREHERRTASVRRVVARTETHV